MKIFLEEENGSITVAFSLLTPFIIFYFLWIVSSWQARYIQVQTKAVIDFAVLGGATTGVVEKSNISNSLASAYIPIVGGIYTDVSEYGSEVTIALLKENAYETLPEDVAKQICEQAENFWTTPEELSLQNSGLMHFKVTNIKYRSLVPLLVDNWNFTIESTAQVQVK